MATCCANNVVAGREGAGTDWLRVGFAALVAAQSMVFGLAVNLSPPDGVVRLVLHGVLALAAVVVFLLVGLPVWREALAAALERRIVVEQFFLLGIFGAFGVSLHATLTGYGSIYYEVVAVLVAIYTFGSVIGRKRREAALATAETYQRQFAEARVLRMGSEARVPVCEVGEGERVLLRAGEGIAVDGTVEEGVGFVTEAALTGEPFPVVRRAGDPVRAGSHVLDSHFVVRAHGGSGRRELDRIIEAVRLAQMRPTRLQREADRLVSWFLPVVLTVALATFAYWYWQSGWVVAMFNALAVILVACPCAMGLATPIGTWGALGALASRGLLCQSGDMVERLAQCDTFVFDKTGTLSDGDMALRDFVCDPSTDRALLAGEVAAVQAVSPHPVARAFSEWATDDSVSVGRVETLPGVGIRAEVVRAGRSHVCEIGNEGLLGAGDRAERERLRGELLAEAGGSGSRECYVRRDGRLVGVAVLSERLRASASAAIARLREDGFGVRVMTGDRPGRAESLGIEGVVEIRSGLSPEEKAAEIAKLSEAGFTVCFVGDGINDAPAMSAAHAGIALAEGADLPNASAGGRLFGGNLAVVPEAARVCRRVVGAVRGNLVFAASYNTLGIGLAACGLLHPVAAALIMLVSSVTVTWRALRFAGGIQKPEGAEGGEPESLDAWGGGAQGAASVGPAGAGGGGRRVAGTCPRLGRGGAGCRVGAPCGRRLRK